MTSRECRSPRASRGILSVGLGFIRLPTSISFYSAWGKGFLFFCVVPLISPARKRVRRDRGRNEYSVLREKEREKEEKRGKKKKKKKAQGQVACQAPDDHSLREADPVQRSFPAGVH